MKKILLAMVEVGNGHKAPALAIKEGLKQLYPAEFEVEVLDFSLAIRAVQFDRQHKASWQWMLEHPRTTFKLQRLIDEVIPIPLTRWVQGLSLQNQLKPAADFIQAKGYDLLVATHFLPLQALTLARSRFQLKQPLVGLVTDPFDGHALWAERHMDALIVSSYEAKAKLVAKGVPEAALKIFPYPLRLSFSQPPPAKEEARARLGLDLSAFTILQSAGAEGLGGQLEAYIQAICKADLPLQYIIACGRNQALYARLSELARSYQGKTRILPQGFIEDMPSWIAASDLVLGKAGAASTFEPLLLGRPIFHTSYVAQNEKANIDFCLAKGIGAYLPEPEQLVAKLRGLLQNSSELVALEHKICALGLRSGTLEIADYLVKTFVE